MKRHATLLTIVSGAALLWVGVGTAAGARDDELADSLMLLLEGAHMSRVTMATEGLARMLPRAARALIAAHLDR